MMLKTGLGVAQDYTVFNHGPPSPHKDLNPQDRTILAQLGMNLAPIFFSQGTAKRKWEVTTPQMC